MLKSMGFIGDFILERNCCGEVLCRLRLKTNIQIVIPSLARTESAKVPKITRGLRVKPAMTLFVGNELCLQFG